MKLNEISKIINGEYLNNIRSNKEINKYKINTKELEENDIFISINDGYKYINKDTKFLAIITDKKIKIFDHPIIKVKNIYKALNDLAYYYRKKYNKTRYIAITGSVGKTTTKELLYEILKTKYNVYKNYLNYNNHIGLPLTLINMKKNYDYAVIEVGMNHKGEIDKLTNILKPDIGVITNIYTQHIGNFKNYQEIINAKLEITNHLNGPLFIDYKYNEYTNYKNIINFKKHNTEILSNEITKTVFILDQKYKITLNSIGNHLIENITKCIDLGQYFNIELNEIINVINEFRMPQNRLNIYQKEFILIDDTYNSSKEGVLGILDSIKNIKKDKIIILGSILELGDYSRQIHQEINNKLKEIKSEVLLIGKETEQIDGLHFNSNEEIINYLKSKNLNNKLILIKGSHALKLYEVVNNLLS